jgi:pimeloyl-CoA synthetase
MKKSMLISKIYHLNVLLIFFRTSDFRPSDQSKSVSFKLNVAPNRLLIILKQRTACQVNTSVAVNMEFVRSADKSFIDGVAIAADLGYKYIEPMVHTGWELLSEVNYFHSFSMEEDPL